MSEAYDYNVYLLGILPQGYAFGPKPQRWDVDELQLIVSPCEQSGIVGTVEKKGHANLADTAIIERIRNIKPATKNRHGNICRDGESSDSNSSSDLSGSYTSATTTDGDETEDDKGEHSDTDDEKSSRGNTVSTTASSSSIPTCSSAPSYASVAAATPKFKLLRLDEWNRGSFRMKWLKNNYNPRVDTLPDILSCRRLLNRFMTDHHKFFTVKAKKVAFFSRKTLEKHVVIELTMGYSFKDLNTAIESTVNKGGRRERDDSNIGHDYVNNIAFFFAVLKRKATNRKGLSTANPLSHKINILLDAPIQGVWKKYDKPEHYNCKDIAEIRHVKAATIYPAPWQGYPHHYHQSVLPLHWSLSMLSGAKKYNLNVYGDQNEFLPSSDSKLTEMWQYDVDKIPAAIPVIAKKEGFKQAWHKSDMVNQLYGSLQYIRNYMANMAEDEVVHFVHYENESHLLPLMDDDMEDELNCLREAKKTIVIRNVFFDSPDLAVAEVNARKFLESLLTQISGSDRWPKPQLLMYPEEQTLYLKFKYLQHSTSFIQVAKKFLKTHSSREFRSIVIERKLSDRMKNLTEILFGYDDSGVDEHNRHYEARNNVHGNQVSLVPTNWSFNFPALTNSPTWNGNDSFFLNATTDQNWRITLHAPIVPTVPRN